MPVWKVETEEVRERGRRGGGSMPPLQVDQGGTGREGRANEQVWLASE